MKKMFRKSGVATATTSKRFAGNGMSKTAMIWEIARIAEHKLTVPQLKKIDGVNPRSLEDIYNKVVSDKSKGDALFALKLILTTGHIDYGQQIKAFKK